MFALREEDRVATAFVAGQDLQKFHGQAMPERLEMVREATDGSQRGENRDLFAVGHAGADERSSAGW